MTERQAPDRGELSREYRARGWWREETLADDIARYAAQRPDDAAFITENDRITWRQYDDAADQLAGVLVAAGFQRGERVAVQLPDTAAVHIAFVGLEKAGLVAVGIGARAGEREVRYLLARTGASGLITHAEHRGRVVADDFESLRSDAPKLRHHVVMAEKLTDPGITVDGALVAPAPIAQWRDRKLGPDELWLVNSTSGTTGLPKCVMHHQNRWYYFHRIAEDVGGLRSDDIVLGAVPAPFGFGQWTSHFTPTLLGAPAVVMERFNASGALALIERERVTVLCAVSTQFILMLNAPDIDQYDLSSLRVMFTGGEMIPYERARDFERRTGATVLNFYGSNESGFATATTIRDPTEKRLRTAGRVQPGTELRLYDDDGVDVTASGRGQPGSRGPAISFGYLDDPVANAELFTPDGFVIHADEVTLDGEGYLTVVGRKSDIIIRGGKNISAPYVEDEVGAHPSVALAAAVASPDPVFGERVCVYVELTSGSRLELEELVAFLRSRGVSSEYLPERLVVMEELPRSSGGKLAKGSLREDASARFGAGR
ncbi:MAG TPA: class I adenylate-forming enzyme family protein [Frankiaceae bacterium]|nr:class I adenylate-forming enzyme family protein [Frankiaceae bacterium]